MTEKISNPDLKEIQPLTDPSNMSLDALIGMVRIDYLKSLHEKSAEELKLLRTDQNKVRELHDLLKAINQATDKNTHEVDFKNNPDLKERLQRAKELGIETPSDATSFNRDERERKVADIRNTLDDIQREINTRLHTLQTLTNERYEAYQYARMITKTHHDDKKKMVANAGR